MSVLEECLCSASNYETQPDPRAQQIIRTTVKVAALGFTPCERLLFSPQLSTKNRVYVIITALSRGRMYILVNSGKFMPPPPNTHVHEVTTY